jgi:hypothetical protein
MLKQTAAKSPATKGKIGKEQKSDRSSALLFDAIAILALAAMPPESWLDPA